jgi:ABC-type transport system substrate-binding protein
MAVVLLGLALVVLALAGCTVSAAQLPAAQPTTPTVAAPATASTTAASAVAPTATAPAAGVGTNSLPLGTYTNGKTAYGPLVLTLADGGQYALRLELENELIQGTWKVMGDQIELTETSGGLCPNLQGTYKWALEGKDVSFTLVQDSCIWNTTLFDSQAWTRQQ